MSNFKGPQNYFEMAENPETGEMEPIISPGNTGGMYDFAVMTPEA
jgi:hypothetical protein